MPPWNLVLQFLDLDGRVKLSPDCARFSLPGLSRPCRILILACDINATSVATTAHHVISQHLQAKCVTFDHCGGPPIWGCMTWSESSCMQLLIPIIGQALSADALKLILDWQNKAGHLSRVLPALTPGLAHNQAFLNTPHGVSRLNRIPWHGNPQRLASIVMQHATQSSKPGIFLSYRRNEAGRLADQLFDGLAHRGYRVFVDRFSGSPGRYFPHELAEEMADKAVVVVLETPNIAQSVWTLWEIRFAHRYKLGLVSLMLPNAPRLQRIRERLNIYPNANGELAPNDCDSALDFIEREHVIANLRRRAFYEALIASAAASKGGRLHDAGSGLLELRNRRGVVSGLISPVGRPGQLADARNMDVPIAAPPVRMLIGQHQHLPLSSREDLNWLAQKLGIELAGHYDSYLRVQNLC